VGAAPAPVRAATDPPPRDCWSIDGSALHSRRAQRVLIIAHDDPDWLSRAHTRALPPICTLA
jgi:hypothetical protein